MDFLLLLKAAVLGVVEGLAEFLPISSTGHLIVVGELIGFLGQPMRGVFQVAIQLGAILAVCWLYRERLWRVAVGLPHDPAAQRFTFNLLVAFLPAMVFGLLFYKIIKGVLFAPVPVAIALVVGGLFILWAEKRRHVIRVQEVEQMTARDALLVGLAQCLALVPGTSRSGATIIGGLFVGLSRKAATEFSFFLAIPTMFAATVYDVYKHRDLFYMEDVALLATGFIAAFVAAFFTVRGLVAFVSRRDFTPFAWYRIAFGLIVLWTAYAGWVDWSAV
ncbi:MAG TPA: undecaprenyl-diphosphate phosphatase [Burkholderiales bacterium]|jgi:undecaprenyl-diphosphatase UppP